MTSPLSTNELFHFTRFEYLLNIIRTGFYPRYNLEHTHLSELFDRPATVGLIPMVCFCDIPLESVKEHAKIYGRSAIGLDKSWGRRFGLNPVIYIQKESRIGDALSAITSSISKYNSSMLGEDSDIQISILLSRIFAGCRQLCYLVKQYERIVDETYVIGDKLRIFKKGRFYDEREWRFVPNNTLSDMWSINYDVYDDQKLLEIAHKNLEKHALRFNADDIKIIVYEKDKEREEIANAISVKFNLTMEQIESSIEFVKISSMHEFGERHINFY